jgi:hypothetical protein
VVAASAQALLVELGVEVGVELDVELDEELPESEEVDDEESDEPLEDSELDGVEVLVPEAVVLDEPPRASFL